MAGRAMPLLEEALVRLSMNGVPSDWNSVVVARCSERPKPSPSVNVRGLLEIELAGQRDIAVFGGGELVVEFEVGIEILPSVGRADISARARDERTLAPSASQMPFLFAVRNSCPTICATLPLLPHPPTARCGASST